MALCVPLDSFFFLIFSPGLFLSLSIGVNIDMYLPGASVGGMVFVFSIVDGSVVVVVVVGVVDVTGFTFLQKLRTKTVMY